MEKEFTAHEMIEFANWFTDHEITNTDLQQYREALEHEAEKEWLLYLTLKAKYELETTK